MSHKVQAVVVAIAALVWVPLLFAYPLVSHWEGTFSGASVEVLQEPYRDSPVLKYIWRGEVYRSCPITIERFMTTSEGVVLTLEPSIRPALPVEDLGYAEIHLTVETPSGMPEGRTVYQPVERPKCDWLQWLFPPRVPYPPVEFYVTR
jgi:hypothetical protein